MSGPAVQVHLGFAAIMERLCRELEDHYNAEKDALYNVVADGFGNKYTTTFNAGPTPTPDPEGHIPGIYLPDLEVTFRQIQPGVIERAAYPAYVTAMVGPISGLTPTEDRFITVSGEDQRFTADFPFACSMLFYKAAQEPVTTPGGRPMTVSEIMQYRSMYYLGALEHCLAKHCPTTTEIRRLLPVDAFPLTGAVFSPLGPSVQRETLVGQAYYEFTVNHTQATPKPVGQA